MKLTRLGGKALSSGLTQALPSLTSFSISASAARNLDITGFGEFGIAFTVCILIIGLTRSFTAEAVMYSSSEPSERRPGINAVLSLCTLGSTLAILNSGIWFIITGTVSLPLVIFISTVIVLVHQDIARNLLVAAGKDNIALSLEAIIICLVIFQAIWLTPPTVETTFLIWMSASIGPAIAGTFFLQPSLHLRESMDWFIKHRRLSASLSIDYLLSNGASHAAVFIVAATTGTTGAAAMRGAQMIVAPLQVLARSLMIIIVAKRSAIDSYFPKLRTPARIGCFYSVLLAPFPIVILFLTVSVPQSAAYSIFGESTAQVLELMPFALLAAALFFFASGGALALRLLGDYVRVTTIRAKIFPFSLGLITIGSLIYGAPGSQIAIAMSEATRAVSNWSTVGKRRG